MARTVVGSVSFVFFMTLVGLLDGRLLTFVLAGLAFAVVLFLGVRLVWKLEEWLHPEWQ